MVTRRGFGMISGAIGKRMRWGTALLLALVSLCAALPTNAQGQTASTRGQNIYVPYIHADGGGSGSGNSSGGAATPGVVITTGDRVYGLLGTFDLPSGQQYTYYLVTPNGGYFALAGQTPEIEQRLDALALNGETEYVKVWGAVQASRGAGEPLLIVVTGILGTTVGPATPIPTTPIPATPVPPTPVPPTATPVVVAVVPVAVVKFDAINLYGGPGTEFAPVGQVVMGQECEVTGRNQANSWLQLTCGDGQQGWVDARLVSVQGNLANVVVINNTTPPTAQPTAVVATATPTPVAFTGWRMELYNNVGLSGSPVAVVDVPNLNFNWGSGGPSQVGADTFSVRFSRRITVTPAYYQFAAVADDGVRVWVDGKLIINAWPADPSKSYVVGQVLTGSHDILVEYYEQTGLASVRLDYAPVVDSTAWQASYYYGVTPSGNPAFSQQEPRGQNPLDYNWSTGAPQSAALGSNVLGNDYWSARWQGEFNFEGGNFVFRSNVDDGIRLYLDGLLVLNQWSDGYKETSNRVLGIGPGQHTILVEYYERSGNASIKVWWYRDSAYTGPQ